MKWNSLSWWRQRSEMGSLTLSLGGLWAAAAAIAPLKEKTSWLLPSLSLYLFNSSSFSINLLWMMACFTFSEMGGWNGCSSAARSIKDFQSFNAAIDGYVFPAQLLSIPPHPLTPSTLIHSSLSTLYLFIVFLP